MARLAQRMTDVPPYLFVAAERRIRQKEQEGVAVVNLGAGSPDLPPPDWITDAMVAASRVPAHHRYPSYSSTPELRRAWAEHYRQRFDVELDPHSEVLPLIGSKEGIAHLAFALVDPGDLVLVPDPAYPAYAVGTRLAGGTPYPMPLHQANGYLPDLDAIPVEVLERAVAMWINYPNNPTAAVAPWTFYERVIDLAHRHDFVVLSDNPYAEVTFDGYEAPSLLQVPGALEVGLEINSLSKTYNMAGWRIGAAVGNSELIQALLTIKSNVDTGIFYPLQAGAVAALTGDQTWIEERNEIYQRRRDTAMEGLRAAGFQVERPAATLYVWPRLPDGISGTDLAIRMLEEAAVWMTPGEAFGEHGRGYMRLSLCTTEEKIREALERVEDLMHLVAPS